MPHPFLHATHSYSLVPGKIWVSGVSLTCPGLSPSLGQLLPRREWEAQCFCLQ